MLKRSISGSTTTLTAYAYGLQELTYTGAGAFTSQTDYYSVAGHLIGSTNGTTTTYDLTDAEGSVLTSISASVVLGEQVYGPYGNQRYVQGTLGTDKGYTGQFHDAVSGFDYYNARYYDPVMAQFLSADVKQGNAQGMDPYSYVAGNPETATDPTGQSCGLCGSFGGSVDLSGIGNLLAGAARIGSTVHIPAAVNMSHSSGTSASPSSSTNSNGGNLTTSVAPPPPPRQPVLSCSGTQKSCGASGAQNTGPSLLRQSGADLDNSDELVGIGDEGINEIIQRLQILENALQNGDLEDLLSPNGTGQLSGQLATVAGIAAFAAALIPVIGEGVDAAVLTAGLLGAILSAGSGVAAAQSSSGGKLNAYAETVNNEITQISDLRQAIEGRGGDINEFAFTVTELDTYYVSGYKYISSPPATFGGPIIREKLPIYGISSANFVLDIQYQG